MSGSTSSQVSGGWDHALNLAGWVGPVWTGSCPCQPFSIAGSQKGFDDPRHLWPAWKKLIRIGKPATIFGEQVAAAADWLRLVRGDLEALDYTIGIMPIEAACAGAYHLRDRYWFVACSGNAEDSFRKVGNVANANSAGSQGRQLLSERADQRVVGACGMGNTIGKRRYRSKEIKKSSRRFGAESTSQWIICADGKIRRIEPGICLLANGVPNRVGLLRGFGNAIDPRPAANFIKAYMMALAEME